MRKSVLAGSVASHIPQLQCAVGSFNTGTGTSNVVVSGLGFTPKAVIFWWSGRTNTSDSAGGANHFRGMGFATSPTERFCIGCFSEDAQPTCDSDRAMRIDACVVRMNTTTGIDGLADLASFQSGGFTIAIDDAFSVSQTVHFLALGGDAITAALAGAFQQTSGVTGNVDVSIGFQPSLMMFLCTAATSIANQATANALQSYGAADGKGGQWTFDICEHNGNTDDIMATHASDSYALAVTNLSDVLTRGVIAAGGFEAVADGFRVNWLEAGLSAVYPYLALKGVRTKVGSFETQTNTTPFSITGLGFQPRAIMFFSLCAQFQADDTLASNNGRWSVGAAVGPTERGAHATKNQAGAGTSVVGSAVEFDEVYINLADNDTIQGLMDVVSFDDDGFTMVMDDADPAAARVGYIAFGDSI